MPAGADGAESSAMKYSGARSMRGSENNTAPSGQLPRLATKRHGWRTASAATMLWATPLAAHRTCSTAAAPAPAHCGGRPSGATVVVHRAAPAAGAAMTTRNEPARKRQPPVSDPRCSKPMAQWMIQTGEGLPVRVGTGHASGAEHVATKNRYYAKAASVCAPQAGDTESKITLELKRRCRPAFIALIPNRRGTTHRKMKFRPSFHSVAPRFHLLAGAGCAALLNHALTAGAFVWRDSHRKSYLAAACHGATAAGARRDM